MTENGREKQGPSRGDCKQKKLEKLFFSLQTKRMLSKGFFFLSSSRGQKPSHHYYLVGQRKTGNYGSPFSPYAETIYTQVEM